MWYNLIKVLIKVNSMNAIINTIGNIVSRLVLGQYADKIAETSVKVNDIDKDVDEIKGDVKQLSSRVIKLEAATIEVQQMFKNAGAPVYFPLEMAPGSPLKLTEYGEKIAQETDAYKIIEDNKDLLFSAIDNKKIATPYDIQHSSRSILDDLIDDKIMNDFKKYAFDNGIKIKIILNVVGLILRDEYLKDHPDIK